MMIDFVLYSLLLSAVLSSVLILLVLALRRVFAKTMSYRILAFLWALLLLRLLVPFTLESPVNLSGIFNSTKPTAQIEGTSHYSAANYDDYSYEGNYAPGEDMQGQDDLTVTPDAALSRISDFIHYISRLNTANLIIVAWLSGIAFVLLKSAFKMLAFANKTTQCKMYADENVTSIIKAHKKTLGIKADITIKECAYIRTPVIMGSANPVILIPEGMFNVLDTSSVSMIILHEMCHIKSGDLIKNKLWLIAKAIHWFNPLVWIGYKAFLDDLEKSCDRNVLKNLAVTEKTGYLDALLSTAKLIKPTKVSAAMLCFGSDKSKLRKRVETMTSKQKPRAGVNIITIMIIAVFTVACFTTACTFGEMDSMEPSYELFATAYATPVPTSTPYPEVTATPEASFNTANDSAGVLYYDGTAPSTPEEISRCTTIRLSNVDDLSFLEGMDNIKSIKTADYSEGTLTFNISGLAALKNLEEIDFVNCSVSGDIGALSGLTKLKTVRLSRTGVTGDIASLTQLTNLETLIMAGTAVKGDIASLKNAVYLTSIFMGETRVSGDISALSSLINLRTISLDETNISGDISALAKCRMLEEVYIGSTPVTGDIAVFAGLPYIEWVAIEMTNVYGDVAVFADSLNLRVLYIFATDVSGDISALEVLGSLEQVLYDGSQVTGTIIIPEDRAMG